MNQVAVIIPAFNAQHTLGQVLEGVCRHIPAKDIVVVDDGSDDATAETAMRHGAVSITHGANRGKGAALATGFTRGMRDNYKAMITMDADGQHSPDDIPAFLQAFRSNRADLILGNRMHRTTGMPWRRVITNTLSSRLVSAITGIRIPDSQSGFRLLSTRLLRTLKLYSTGYNTETELLLKAAAAGARVASLPVRTIYGSEKSHFRPVRDTFAIFGTLGQGALRRALAR